MTSSALNSSAQALAGTLAAQYEAAVALAGILQRKQRILVEHRLDELQACADAEQAQSARLAQLEETRRTQAAGLALALAGPGGLPEGLPLRELLFFMPATSQTELLRDTALALQSELDHLLALNHDNNALAQQMLNYTTLVLRLLAQGGHRPGYSARGQLSDAPVGAGLALVDNRV